MKFIFFQLIHFRYCCSRKMIALDPEAADRVSDGHEKKLGKGTLPTQRRNFLFTIHILPSQNIHDNPISCV